MNFLQKLTNFFTPSAPSAPVLWFTVQCHRCGEQIKGRINLHNDLSPEYDGSDAPASYVCRKVLIGEGQQRCFQQIEVVFKFDGGRKVVDKTATGGKFVEET